MADTIVVQSAAVTIDDCESVIIVPEIAVEEPGYINSITIKNRAHAKHEFHAMAQMAYFQFQDDELSIEEIESSLNVILGDQNIELSGGMILCRNLSGKFRVLIHATQDRKKLLEAAYRYCTRWVRLDI